MRNSAARSNVDSLSESDGPVPTYLDLIRHDAQVISEALTGGRG
jgi:manganese transport system substrate-binding protein